MLKYIFWFVVSFSFFYNSVFAQKIHGKVSDINGKALPGVSVSVKELTFSQTLTDAQGFFQIEKKEGARHLSVQYSGMISQEIELSDSSELNIILIPNRYPKFRMGFGFTLGGASVDVKNSDNQTLDTAISVKLTPISFHADLSYWFSKKFFIQSTLETDFNFLKYENEETGTTETGVMRRTILGFAAFYNVPLGRTGKSSYFLGGGLFYQKFSVFDAQTVGLRLQSGFSFGNYGFNKQIFLSFDLAGGDINGLDSEREYRFSYSSFRIGMNFNF